MAFEHRDDGWRRFPLVETVHIGVAFFYKQLHDLEPPVCSCVVEGCVFGQITEVGVDTAPKQHADDVVLAVHAGFNKRRLLLFVCTVDVRAFIKQILSNFKLPLSAGDGERGFAVEIL